MATLTPQGQSAPTALGRRPMSALELLRWLRSVLDRPLTSYHLVLGSVALLLVVGVMMVLSASIATSSLKRSLDTRRKSPHKSLRRSTLEQWHKPLRRPLPWPDLVMLSCLPRGAPAWTCSPITPHAEMLSLPRCARSQRSRRQWRP